MLSEVDSREVDTVLCDYYLRVDTGCCLRWTRERLDTVLWGYCLRVDTVVCLGWTRERLTRSYVITI